MEKHKRKYLKNYRPPEYWIDKIDLKFDINEDKIEKFNGYSSAFIPKYSTRVTSIMKIRRNFEVADINTPMVFNCAADELESVIADDMVLCPDEYDLKNEKFILKKVPDEFTLEIVTLLNPENNTRLEGLYKSGSIFCTQCEAEGFRRITCFPDRPDIMTEFSCIIIADKSKYPVLLSNGNLISQGDLPGGRHFVKWEDPFKKPSYLFALVAGDLACIEDDFTTCSGRNISLKIYVEHENKNKCAYAMESLKQAMKWDEERFGREYDLDLYQIVAVNDFNMGAMENKGLNIFNSKYVLAKPKTATDMDFMNIQGVIAHEYFHNWTGNRITLKNWFQLSLKEGLTVFRDQEFSSDMNSKALKRITDVKKLKKFQFPEDSSPMVHPVRPESYIEMNNFYTMTVYNKGAELIRMIFLLLGKEVFRKGMDLYFKRFDGQAVTIEDFIKTMEDVYEKDLSQFRLWYSQSGTPVVTIKREYDPETERLCIHLTQHIEPDKNQKIKKPVHIPVKTGLINEKGRDILPGDCGLLEFKSNKESFVFNNIPGGTIPSMFRGFSAPVKIKNDFSPEELAFLMANDSDEFNRWDSAQELFLREIFSLVEKVKNNKSLKISDHLKQAFKKAVHDVDTDPYILAMILTIPDENEIAGHFTQIDVDAIHRARLFLKQDIAMAFDIKFQAIITQCLNSDIELSDMSYKAMANRSLKNLALSYMGALGTTDAAAMIHDIFMHSGNMTDEIASLSVLCNMDSNLTEDALERFYFRWKSDPIVMDKWFSVQSGSIFFGTLEKVKKLSCHPDFSMTNPNRIRALTGVFATQNPFNFHRYDGKGYSFLAEQIMLLDKTNPQISAHLVSAFNHWKKYDLKRQAAMRRELEKIISVSGISADVYEIVSNALEN